MSLTDSPHICDATDLETPRVSIVIPVYNGADFVRSAIESALAQTYPALEIIVVNDGSDDNHATRGIGCSFGNRVRYIEKPNGGVSSALNAAIKVMQGDYLAWLSHDDEFLPHKLERQIELLRKQPDPDRIVLFGGYRILNVATGVLTDGPRYSAESIERSGQRYWLEAILDSQLHGCTTLIPRRVLTELGGFDPALKTTQDYDFFIRMLAAGVRFAYQAEPLIITRHHARQGTSVMRQLHARELEDFFTRSVETLQEQLSAVPLCALLDFMLILRRRRQSRALVRLFNTWCNARRFPSASRLWLYWESPQDELIPEYILLCWLTIAKHCSADFHVTLVDPCDLSSFAPDLDPCYQRLREIAHRADYIRFKLLLNHGGVWLDSDMVVHKSLAPFVSSRTGPEFLSMGYRETDGDFFPLIAFLAAPARHAVVAEMVARMTDFMRSRTGAEMSDIGWDDMGGRMLQQILKRRHVETRLLEALGLFTVWPLWHEPGRLFDRPSRRVVEGLQSSGLICQALSHSQDGARLKAMSASDILRSDTVLGYNLRIALSDVPRFLTIGTDVSPDARYLQQASIIRARRRPLAERVAREMRRWPKSIVRGWKHLIARWSGARASE